MNGGHGHVIPRPDGVKARCGGPGICSACSAELAQVQAGSASTSDAAPADGIVSWTCTRIQLIDALAALPLGGYLTLEARSRFADCILAQLPEASPAGAYMEGVKAERERIRQRLIGCRKCDEIHAEYFPEGYYDHASNAPWQAAGPNALAFLDQLLGDGPLP